MRPRILLSIILAFLIIVVNFQNCTQARLIGSQEESSLATTTTTTTTTTLSNSSSTTTLTVTTTTQPPTTDPGGGIQTGGEEDDNSDPIVRPPTAVCEYQQPNTPAISTPEFIDLFNGTQHKLWPVTGFQPADPPGPLPRERDSSSYTSYEQPCEHWTNPSASLNRFVDMSKQGNFLYVATSSGFSIWDIAGNNARQPKRRIIRDGLCDRGSWLSFPPPGEVDFHAKNVHTYDKGDNETLFVVTGGNVFGVWIHNRSTNSLRQTYQLTKGSTQEISFLVQKNNKPYVVQRIGSELYALDLEKLGSFNGCTESYNSHLKTFSGNCESPNHQLISYHFNNIPGVAYRLSFVRKIGDKVVLLTKAGTKTFELSTLNENQTWSQFSHRKVFTRDQSNFSLLAGAFVKDDKFYVVASKEIGSRDAMIILDVTSCIQSTTPCNQNYEIFNYKFAQGRTFTFVNFSTNNQGKSYLYLGRVVGASTERLLDITSFSKNNPIMYDVTSGSSYVDPCTGHQLNYLEAMSYPATYGTKNRLSYFGKWFGKYFYRGSWMVFDVHEFASP